MRFWASQLAVIVVVAGAASAAEPSADRPPAEQALEILRTYPDYTFGTNPRAEAWIESVIDERAAERTDSLRDTRATILSGLGIDPDPEALEAQMAAPAIRDLVKDQTGTITERLEKIYAPLREAATLESKLALMADLPAAARVDDLTLAWLRRRVLEYVRLYVIDAYPALGREAVEASVRRIFDFGPRTVGQTGHASARAYVEEKFVEIGLERVSLDRFDRASPVDEGARIFLAPPDGDPHTLYAIWPNQSMPSTLPEGGIEGPLVYLGRGSMLGRYEQDVDGAIVLLEFRSKANWQWWAMHGAQAAILLHQDDMVRKEAADKFINLPVNFPRYYADEALSARLRGMAEKGVRVRLEGTMRWTNVPCGNVLGLLPATVIVETRAGMREALRTASEADPVPAGLAEALAADGRGPRGAAAGLAEAEIESWPPEVVRWTLRRVLRYEEQGYAGRLASRLKAMAKARQAVVMTGPLDSMCCAPAAPHGADQSGGLVALLAVTEYLAKASPLRRNNTVIVTAVDSQYQAIYGGRSLGAILRYGEEYFADAAEDFEEQAARTAYMTEILADPDGYAYGRPNMSQEAGEAFRKEAGTTVGDVEEALLKQVRDWLDFRRAGVAAQRSEEVMGTGEAYERTALDVRLDVYKALGRFSEKDLKGHLLALKLLDPALGEPVDRAEVLGRLKQDPARVKAIAKTLEEVGSLKEVRALPAETLRAMRASMAGPEEVTYTFAREKMTNRLEVIRKRLAGQREDARLAALLAGFEDADTAIKVAEGLAKDGAEDLAAAEDRLVALVREERYEPIISCSLDLSSHSRHLTLNRQGSSALAAGGLPNNFLWTIQPNLSQHYVKSLRFANDLLDLAPVPLFVDTVSADVGNLYTPAESSAPTGLFTLAGITPYAFATAEDPRYIHNTPADVPDRVNFDALATQVKTAAIVVDEMLSDESLLARVDRIRSSPTEIKGRIVRFDVRAGAFPNMPVDGALVYLPRGGGGDQGGKGAGQTGGVISHMAVLADGDGHYHIPFEPDARSQGGKDDMWIWAYGFDYERGLIDMAIDKAEAQLATFENRLRLQDPVEQRNLLVFRCAAATIFNPIDPRYLRELQTIQVLDGKGKSQPRHYSTLTVKQTKGRNGDADPAVNCAVAFVPQNLRVQVMMGQQHLGARRLVLLGVGPEDPTGNGYPVGRGRLIEETTLRVARDMTGLNAYRLDRLGEAGIRSTKLEELMARARGHLEAAEAALEEHRYGDLARSANAAWGYAARAYPEVTQTANDAVYGVVFFLVLLLPFAYFMERLTFGFKTAVSRVGGMLIWFTIVFLLLFWVHPAFQISLTPLVILLAFALLVLASVVLVLVSARFGEQVKKWRQQAGGVHSADVSRLSTTAVAFNLGIANLGKRKSRTVLTIVTLILLAFSVISFTSIQEAADHLPIPLAEGAPYSGLMFRMPLWKNMVDSIATALEVEFGGRHTLVKRGWRMEAEGGWGAWLEGKNDFPLARLDRPDAKAIVQCIAGFEAAEADLTGIDQCITVGRWMAEGERNVVIVPREVADTLGLTDEDVRTERVRVRHAGQNLTVIGILDARKADAIRGLNNESIAPVDYLASGSEGGNVGGTLDIESDVGMERPFEHMSFRDVAIAPLDGVLEMSESHLKAACVKFAPGTPEEHREVVDELMSRLAINVYAGVGDQRYLIRSVGLRTIRPDWALLAPIALAVLIILNTMLGTVEERKGEIGMLGAVGLAPRHVAMLFFTEASVYANAGVVVGYLVGQVMAKLVVSMGWFGELSLNYSSLAALFTAALVAVIVLAATVYPARKAAALATPSGAARWAMPGATFGRRLEIELPFTLTRGNAVGMGMFLHEHFESHADPTSPDFSTSGLRTRARVRGGGATLILQMIVYPTPYDLGVSQRCRVIVYPTEREGVYGVRFTLRRLSSDEGSWMRTNFRFMDLIRKQFLIWRTIRLEERRSYIERGLQLFQ